MKTKTGMKRQKKNRIWNESGQVLIIATISLVVLLGFAGLATDVGYLRYMKQRMQSAADAGAIGGASELAYGSFTTAAQNDASKNGFENNVNGVSVTVNNPPKSGQHTLDLDPTNAHSYVEVIVAQPQPTFFMKALGKNSVDLQARAVGVLKPGPCMVALSSSSSGAFKLTPGGGYAVEVKCGIIIESNSTSALQTNGNTLTANSIGIVGGCKDCGANVTPSPTHIDPVANPDPLAYLPNPTPSGTSRANPNISADSHTLQPGIYANGITIGYVSGNPGPDVTFAAGEYYITGGNFTVSSPSTDNNNADGLAYQHPNLHGSGVFFYIGLSSKVVFPSGNRHFSNSNYGGLSAPTTGTYAGILFYQARGNSNDANLSSGLGDGFTGALYFRDADLKYSNSKPNSAKYMIFVAQTIDFYRDMATVQTINSDYSDLPGGSPIHTAVLAE